MTPRSAAERGPGTPDLDALAALLAAATEAVPRPLTLTRYQQGGGRLFAGNQLVADFYDEANRELFVAVESQLPALIEAARREAAAVELLRSAHRGDWCQLPGEVWDEIDALLHDNAGAATGLDRRPAVDDVMRKSDIGPPRKKASDG